ncbi:MAG: 2Fe-2S iron-sulfur cluster-binding protein [Rhodospirillaceae bacterium]
MVTPVQPLTCTFVTSDGRKHVVEIAPGHTVMSAAINARIPGIDGSCGGNSTCVTCHIYLNPEWLSKVEPPSSMEESMLDFTNDVRETSRLACQIPLNEKLDGLTVFVPDRQRVLGL